MKKLIQAIYLFFIVFPIGIIYGGLIAIYTTIEYVIEKCKIR